MEAAGGFYLLKTMALNPVTTIIVLVIVLIASFIAGWKTDLLGGVMDWIFYGIAIMAGLGIAVTSYGMMTYKKLETPGQNISRIDDLTTLTDPQKASPTTNYFF